MSPPPLDNLQFLNYLNPRRSRTDDHVIIFERPRRTFGAVVAFDVDQVEKLVRGGVAECADFQIHLIPTFLAPRFQYTESSGHTLISMPDGNCSFFTSI